jgi:hypothetical protein
MSDKEFHIFKQAPNQREAACGYIAKSDPKSFPQDKAYPRCEKCMEWFKGICWKREEHKP